MLLDFKIKNYKSFYNEAELSMFAENAKKEKKEILIPLENATKKLILPSAVIYGANASGKTTIISAINTLKEIIINGTIKKQANSKPIKELTITSFIHNNKKQKEPICFEITFKVGNRIYNYILNIFATYMEEERKILKEELNIIKYIKEGSSTIERKKNIFIRNEDSIKISKENLKIYDEEEKIDDLETIEKNLNENIDREALFLTTGFKSMISLKIESEIVNWFENKLITIVDFSGKEPIVDVIDQDNEDKNMVYGNKILNRLIKFADFGPQIIGYKKDNNTGKYSLVSIYNDKIIVNSRDIESKGTIKLINFWVSFIYKFKEGGIFILDEFDASIHPEIIGGIIDLFNNPEINTAKSQLIFNTHNPLYLQKRFFRRDQILFIEKDSETYMSTMYRLSDFKVNNDVNYMKRYFEGDFGALPFIDFESVINYDEGDKK